MPTTDQDILQKYSDQEYEFGFETRVEMDILPPGLNEETVRFISAKKKSLNGSSNGD